jgi:hypothetical protein
MGAGKTTVLAECSDLLTIRGMTHEALDLDALGLAHMESTVDHDALMYRNLESVCANYATYGVTRLLLARAVQDRTELERCRKIVAAGSTVVCRLAASMETMQERVKIRERGIWQAKYVHRVADANAMVERANLEDFTVSSENRTPTEVAQEALRKAGWIAD